MDAVEAPEWLTQRRIMENEKERKHDSAKGLPASPYAHHVSGDGERGGNQAPYVDWPKRDSPAVGEDRALSTFERAPLSPYVPRRLFVLHGQRQEG